MFRDKTKQRFSTINRCNRSMFFSQTFHLKRKQINYKVELLCIHQIKENPYLQLANIGICYI